MLNDQRERALAIRACMPIVILFMAGLVVLVAGALGWRPASTGPAARCPHATAGG